MDKEPVSNAPLTVAALYGSRAPSTRARILEWVEYLNLEGVEEWFHAGLGDMRPRTVASNGKAVACAEMRLRRQVRSPRTRVLLSREAALLSRGSVEERLLGAAAHSAYDIDDALFVDEGGHRKMYGRPAKARRSASAASVVIAGNEYLAAWASDHAADVRVIPTCVEPEAYEPKSTWRLSDPPSIVWLGSPSTEQYVADIAAQLAEVHRAVGARLRLISSAHETRHTQGLRFVDRVAWSPATFAHQLAECDIAIAPLDDTPWSRGKCAYKLLQYAATGLPIVGSPVGANERALRLFDGVSVRGSSEWSDALLSVLAEPESRRLERGLSGLAAATREYSFSAWADEWKRALHLA